MCVHRKGDNMSSMIEFIYENLQENNLIQKGRKESQQIVEQIVDCVMAKEKITREELSDLLYGLVFIAEKEGFKMGCVCGAKIKEEMETYFGE